MYQIETFYNIISKRQVVRNILHQMNGNFITLKELYNPVDDFNCFDFYFDFQALFLWVCLRPVLFPCFFKPFGSKHFVDQNSPGNSTKTAKLKSAIRSDWIIGDFFCNSLNIQIMATVVDFNVNNRFCDSVNIYKTNYGQYANSLWMIRHFFSSWRTCLTDKKFPSLNSLVLDHLGSPCHSWVIVDKLRCVSQHNCLIAFKLFTTT